MVPNFARALAVLAEALVEGRRVIVVGDSSHGLHVTLGELGARLVHIYDPNEARALAQPPPTDRGTVLRGLPAGDFDVRDGAFDLALVPDLTIASDPAALLARLRRVIGAEGALLCAARNKDAVGGEASFDYYELFDLVSMQFAHIRMLATMPFFGVTVAELGQDEVDTAVRVDTQLAGERETPEFFLALASQDDVALDAYAVIELPAPPATARVTSDTTAEVAAARLRADVLATQLEELGANRDQSARAEEELRQALEALDAERARAALLERELHRGKPERVSALEDGIALAEQTIVVLRERLHELEGAFEQADAERGALLVELAQIRSQGASTEALRALEVHIAELEGDLTHAHDVHISDHEMLEATLRERGETISALSHEVARRESIVRELLVAIDEAGSAIVVAPTEHVRDEDAELRRKLDELAVIAARQQSELEARAWRIAELERTLERAAVSGSPPPSDVAKMKDELFALRQALAQEHAEKERLRASGQSQAVLIEQLSGQTPT